jgi:hypothetical protein
MYYLLNIALLQYIFQLLPVRHAGGAAERGSAGKGARDSA